MCHTRWTVKINQVAGIDQQLPVHEWHILSIGMSLRHLLGLNMAQPCNEQNKCGPKQAEVAFHLCLKYQTQQKKITRSVTFFILPRNGR